MKDKLSNIPKEEQTSYLYGLLEKKRDAWKVKHSFFSNSAWGIVFNESEKILKPLVFSISREINSKSMFVSTLYKKIEEWSSTAISQGNPIFVDQDFSADDPRFKEFCSDLLQVFGIEFEEEAVFHKKIEKPPFSGKLSPTETISIDQLDDHYSTKINTAPVANDIEFFLKIIQRYLKIEIITQQQFDNVSAVAEVKLRELRLEEYIGKVNKIVSRTTLVSLSNEISSEDRHFIDKVNRAIVAREEVLPDQLNREIPKNPKVSDIQTYINHYTEVIKLSEDLDNAEYYFRRVKASIGFLERLSSPEVMTEANQQLNIFVLFAEDRFKELRTQVIIDKIRNSQILHKLSLAFNEGVAWKDNEKITSEQLQKIQQESDKRKPFVESFKKDWGLYYTNEYITNISGALTKPAVNSLVSDFKRMVVPNNTVSPEQVQAVEAAGEARKDFFDGNEVDLLKKVQEPQKRQFDLIHQDKYSKLFFRKPDENDWMMKKTSNSIKHHKDNSSEFKRILLDDISKEKKDRWIKFLALKDNFNETLLDEFIVELFNLSDDVVLKTKEQFEELVQLSNNIKQVIDNPLYLRFLTDVKPGQYFYPEKMIADSFVEILPSVDIVDGEIDPKDFAEKLYKDIWEKDRLRRAEGTPVINNLWLSRNDLTKEEKYKHLFYGFCDAILLETGYIQPEPVEEEELSFSYRRYKELVMNSRLKNLNFRFEYKYGMESSENILNNLHLELKTAKPNFNKMRSKLTEIESYQDREAWLIIHLTDGDYLDTDEASSEISMIEYLFASGKPENIQFVIDYIDRVTQNSPPNKKDYDYFVNKIENMMLSILEISSDLYSQSDSKDDLHFDYAQYIQIKSRLKKIVKLQISQSNSEDELLNILFSSLKEVSSMKRGLLFPDITVDDDRLQKLVEEIIQLIPQSVEEVKMKPKAKQKNTYVLPRLEKWQVTTQIEPEPDSEKPVVESMEDFAKRIGKLKDDKDYQGVKEAFFDRMGQRVEDDQVGEFNNLVKIFKGLSIAINKNGEVVVEEKTESMEGFAKRIGKLKDDKDYQGVKEAFFDRMGQRVEDDQVGEFNNLVKIFKGLSIAINKSGEERGL